MCKTVTPFITTITRSPAVIDIKNKYRLNDLCKFMVSNENLFQCCFSGSSLDGPNLGGFVGRLGWHDMGFAGFELTVPLLVLGMASATQWKRHPVHLQNKDSQQTWTQVIQPIQESRIEKFLRWILVAVFSEVILILDQKVGPKKVIIFTWDLVGRKDTARPEKTGPGKKMGMFFFLALFFEPPQNGLRFVNYEIKWWFFFGLSN